MGDAVDDTTPDEVLDIVRRRAAASFFVVDASGRILLEDRNVRRLPVAVARRVGEIASDTSADKDSTTVMELTERYVIRFVELGGSMGHLHGVFVDTVRERSA